MVGIFSLCYGAIILESLFEWNKASVSLLMAAALWVIYAGTAGAQGIASAAALKELSEHVSEVRHGHVHAHACLPACLPAAPELCTAVLNMRRFPCRCRRSSSS
jgi:ABC-type nickel/cobalt efflux system permease component RcnA